MCPIPPIIRSGSSMTPLKHPQQLLKGGLENLVPAVDAAVNGLANEQPPKRRRSTPHGFYMTKPNNTPTTDDDLRLAEQEYYRTLARITGAPVHPPLPTTTPQVGPSKKKRKTRSKSQSTGKSTRKAVQKAKTASTLKKRKRPRPPPGLVKVEQEIEYHDHSHDPLPPDYDEELVEHNGTKRLPNGGVTVPFPLVLYDLLEEPGNQHIISWRPHGRAFRIHDADLFVRDVLPRFFRQTKISSFQRQLNLYSFQRMSAQGPDKGSYYHEFFLKGRKYLCLNMHRCRVKGTYVRHASNPATEPNFYNMEPLRDDVVQTAIQSQQKDTVDEKEQEEPKEEAVRVTPDSSQQQEQQSEQQQQSSSSSSSTTSAWPQLAPSAMDIGAQVFTAWTTPAVVLPVTPSILPPACDTTSNAWVNKTPSYVAPNAVAMNQLMWETTTSATTPQKKSVSFDPNVIRRNDSVDSLLNEMQQDNGDETDYFSETGFARVLDEIQHYEEV